MKYILGLLFLCMLVLIHEFGHFIAARLCGVYVEEFAIGMGPKIIQRRSKKSGTMYSIRWIPIGGYCAMKGEMVDSEKEPEKDSFAAASVWKRMIIIAAGPFCNLLLGVILAFGLVAVSGHDTPVVTVVDAPPAIEAGLQKGDVILEYNGHRVLSSRELYFQEWYEKDEELQEVNLTVLRDGKEVSLSYEPVQEHTYAMGVTSGVTKEGTLLVVSFLDGSAAEAAGLQTGDIITAIDGHEPTAEQNLSEYLDEVPFTDKEVTLTYERNGEEGQVSFVPTVKELVDTGFGYQTQRKPSEHLLTDTWAELRYYGVSVVKSLTGLVTGRFGLSDMAGPVGIVKQLGDSYETATVATKEVTGNVDFTSLVSLLCLITVNLGLFNLIPIPALDGSHLVFLIIEAVRRKRVSPKIENGVYQVGLLIILGLSVIIILKDFWAICF